MSRIAPFRTTSFAIATQERHTCISAWFGRAPGLWRRWRKEAPETTIPEEAMAERLVQAGGRMEIGDGQAGPSDQELQGAAEAMGSGADVRMALSRNRRLGKVYERRARASTTLIEISITRLLLRRLGRAA